MSAYINKCNADVSVINSAFKSGDKVEQRRARANLNEPAHVEEKNVYLLMLFLDFSSAFNTINS